MKQLPPLTIFTGMVFYVLFCMYSCHQLTNNVEKLKIEYDANETE